jgi:hypothetical protein
VILDSTFVAEAQKITYKRVTMVAMPASTSTMLEPVLPNKKSMAPRTVCPMLGNNKSRTITVERMRVLRRMRFILDRTILSLL